MLKNAFNSIDFSNKALDGSWLRNQAISSNIANVNTPGFKREVIDFESMLKDFVENDKYGIDSDPSSIGFKRSKDSTTSFRLDGNNVDLDQEMAQLAKNQIYYNATITQLNSKIRRLNAAIRDGR